MSNKSGAKRIGRPPGADADKTRSALLDAALRAFAERGFEGTSIREITGEVGVGHNMIRHYFGSKDDLWMAAVQHGLAPAADRLVDMLSVESGEPLRLRLRAGFELLMAEAAANPDAFRLFLAEALRGGPRFDQIYGEVLEPVSMAILRFAAATDEIPDSVDLRVVGIYAFGAVFSPFTFEGLATRLRLGTPKVGEPLPPPIEQLIDMIVAGITGAEG